MKEYERGSLQGHTFCDDCGSSDGLAVYYKDDYGYDGCCYAGCGRERKSKETLKDWGILNEEYELVEIAHKESGTNTIEVTEDLIEKLDKVEKENVIGVWKSRKIKKDASARYGVLTKFEPDGNTVRLRYYPSHFEGGLVGYHVRNDIVKQAKKVDKTVEGASFFSVGHVRTECQLFGQNLFPKGGKYLVITGGEEDAMAVWTALKNGDYETPVVSPTIGETAADMQIAANYKYIESFDNIVLMFDNDSAGKEAVRKITKLFGYGKVLVADLPFKDACDCLKNMDYAAANKAIKKAFWDAVPKKPSQVLTVHDIKQKAMTPPEMGVSMPWPSATKATLGIRRGEIHIVGAAPKIGKTEHQHQLIKHMTDEHQMKVGVMSLEENPVKTLKKVAGKYAGKQFTKPPSVGGYTLQDMEIAFNNLENKIEFYSSDGVRDADEILSTVRYWASKGIWFFIIDPLTALVAEHSTGEANDILNKFMSKAASMCMELQITFFMYSHVNPVKSGTPHDQGGDVLSSQFTGSRAMEKWAHYGWGIQRDRSEKDPIKRNTARVTMLFDREFGEYCEYYAFYDNKKNDWSEVECDEEDGMVSEQENTSFSKIPDEFLQDFPQQDEIDSDLY